MSTWGCLQGIPWGILFQTNTLLTKHRWRRVAGAMRQIAELERLEPLLSGPWDARGVEVGVSPLSQNLRTPKLMLQR